MRDHDDVTAAMWNDVGSAERKNIPVSLVPALQVRATSFAQRLLNGTQRATIGVFGEDGVLQTVQYFNELIHIPHIDPIIFGRWQAILG